MRSASVSHAAEAGDGWSLGNDRGESVRGLESFTCRRGYSARIKYAVTTHI